MSDQYDKNAVYRITPFPLHQGYTHSYGGLTKREWFAGMALQGLCANSIPGNHHITENICKESVEMADQILKQLENQKP
jgi:hypothetical protein